MFYICIFIFGAIIESCLYTPMIIFPTYNVASKKMLMQSEKCGIIPEEWLSGNIIPVYKNKGNKADPKMFRPIILANYLHLF